MKMNRPDLYIKCNNLQRSAVSSVLNEFIPKLKFSRNGFLNILDIGSGSGDTTVELLLPRLPANIHRLIGIDNSMKMVQYAQKCYQRTDNKVVFKVMDISTTCLPADFQNYFDKIFSFFCLHWVDHRMAFRNIFELLKPDGEALLSFLPQNYPLEIFDLLSTTNKWSHHFENVQRTVFCKVKSQEDLKNDLLKLGFNVLDCKIEDIQYKFDSVEEFKRFHEPLHPFISQLTVDLRNEYLTDFMEQCWKLKQLDRTNKKELVFCYQLVTVHIKK